ncbi:hypothetical protein [Intrasporangium sp. YIM S08009]|uniref:hypothetical protein n=1 Tax=Intrasporangium zincisolvens TaxID=3080018 RepID=UPI002B060ECB|nr:hypothetical protein [Intrasporangium sp. YIM S08009]
MAPQFLLEGRSLDELAREATHLYGDGARIVRAERVLDAGIAGFLGRRHLEVTVDVPDSRVPRVVPIQPALHVLGDRAGILALLDSADRAEDDVNADVTAAADADAGRDGEAHAGPHVGRDGDGDPVSTESAGLSDLLARLGDDRDRTGRPAERIPVLLSAPGDLVLVVGLEDTARHVAAGMVDASTAADGHVGYDLHGSGATDPRGLSYLAGRWDAARARALAVESGTTVLVACGLGPTSAGLPHLEAAAALGADQVWLVVDARHKHDDTSAWVDHVLGSVEVDALAVVGAGDSRSAHTVNDLGLPVGWKDGEPAPRTVL